MPFRAVLRRPRRSNFGGSPRNSGNRPSTASKSRPTLPARVDPAAAPLDTLRAPGHAFQPRRRSLRSVAPGPLIRPSGLHRCSAATAAPRQAAAITGEALSAIAATIRTDPRTETPAGLRRGARRDLALLRVMRDGLLRRSEAAALIWADIATEPDGSGRVTVRRSKTDQDGEGSVGYLGAPTVAALEAIRPETPDPDARVFGLSPSQVHRIIRARAAAAGIERAGGHSLRVGTAQDLAATGAGLPEIQQAGRWQDPKMVARYTRHQSAGRGAVARYLYAP